MSVLRRRQFRSDFESASNLFRLRRGRRANEKPEETDRTARVVGRHDAAGMNGDCRCHRQEHGRGDAGMCRNTGEAKSRAVRAVAAAEAGALIDNPRRTEVSAVDDTDGQEGEQAHECREPPEPATIRPLNWHSL